MKKTSRVLLTTWLLSAFMCTVSLAALPSRDIDSNGGAGATSYRVSSVNWEQTPENYLLRIEGGATPTYTMYELFEPLRVIIDIADASLENTVSLPIDLPQGPVSLVNGKVLEDKEPYITRIELFLSEDRAYTVERVDNDIIVSFPKQGKELTVTLADSSAADQTAVSKDPMPTEPVALESVTSQKPIEELVDEQQAMADESPVVETEMSAEPIMEVSQDQESEPMGEVISPEVAPMAEEELPADMVVTSGSATVVNAIEVSHTPEETTVYLRADGPISDYNKVQLAKNIEADRPDRVYIDLKNVRLSGPFETREVGTALAQIRTAKRQNGIRVVFDSSLDHLFDYDITEQPDGLAVTIKEPSAATAVIANLLSDENVAPELDVAPAPQMIEDETDTPIEDTDTYTPPATATILPEMEPAKPVLPTNKSGQIPAKKQAKKSKDTASTPSPADLAFAGYTKQRITVDFYKIDLHNVFRLFGEISNLNIVVDEGVGGSLTLALNDVPWDFALDIILNLKDLQKEERFNTIVISPKSKQFTWPERTLDTVEFKADIKIQQEEAQDAGGIKISKRLEVPVTVVEAKKLIHQAQVNERNGNYEAALPLYEEAVAKWSENINLAKKIAALCLVNLEKNAKAVYYAKSALKLNPSDQEAALQAAIGLARMKRDSEAKEFFDLSVSGAKAPSEALMSYAAYCEEKQDYACSMTMLQRNEDLHGDSLSSMVSKARILDKQGNQDLAAREYRAILLSGYEIPPDLARYIKGRAALGDN